MRADEGTKEVPYVGDLKGDAGTWREALATWLDGELPCEETKKYVGNFMAVYRVRPMGDDDNDAHSSDVVSDEELMLTKHDLKEALSSRIGGKSKDVIVDMDENPFEKLDKVSHYENSSGFDALLKRVHDERWHRRFL